MPKVELHVHLEGSLRPTTLFRLAERNGVDVGASTPDELNGLYQFNDFEDFAKLFFTGLAVLRSAEDFADATVSLAAELAAQNVPYAEVTSTPLTHQRRGVALEEYRDGLNEGRRRARADYGVDLAWVCDIARETEDPESEATIGYLLDSTAPDGVVGLGLGGIEAGFPPELFASSFARAKASGLASLPHAGETVGPESIWGALGSLNADRIGHGVHSLADPDLIAHLAAERIPLEVAPSSNVALKISDSLEAHPLGELAAAGVVVTINTDDPAYFQTTLTDELLAAHRFHGFTRTKLVAAQLAALNASYAATATKLRVRAELQRLLPGGAEDQRGQTTRT
nr:adenosine deaminase [Phytoactinopolyspora alkaliphila]